MNERFHLRPYPTHVGEDGAAVQHLHLIPKTTRLLKYTFTKWTALLRYGAACTYDATHTMHSMSTDKVTAFIHTLCCMDRYGGRCLRINDCTWEVLDIEQWSETQHAAVRARFPQIAAKVTTNRKSLSGFSVLLRLQKAPRMWTSLLVCAVMITITVTIASRFRV